MNTGYFYFLKDTYHDSFVQYGIMPNKSDDEYGNHHGRPYYYSIIDDEDDRIMWMIPVSTKIEKYERIRQQKIEKYNIKDYDGITFGIVRGHKNAFLIQNICPVVSQFIDTQYIDLATNKPVMISTNTQEEIARKARKLISISKRGNRCTMTDVPSLLKAMTELLNNQNP